MDIETLKRGILINDEINAAKSMKDEIHRFYSKKEKLSYDEVERLFAIAIMSNGFAIKRLSEDLKNL